MEEGAAAAGEEERVVCVTGAGGYVASWLVKFLLDKGYRVHGTVREPNDDVKNGHLKKLDGAVENLKLFKADILDYESVLASVAGCEGVFHVAAHVPSSKVANPEVEVIAPAVTGTLNVLRACSESQVKRLIVVSSTAAVTIDPNFPEDKVRDEDCWSSKEYCRDTENWYRYSKTVAEAEAVEYAKKHGLDVITLCPSTILGPMLQSTVNASSLFLIRILKGLRESMDSNARNIVDVRDVAEVLILVYEKPEASGRYICSSHEPEVSEMIGLLRGMYPSYAYPKNYTRAPWDIHLTAEKLKKLGWSCRGLKETLADSVDSYIEAGFLDK